ncbi:hypothetical protein JZ751_028216, partial [Albula glossodonta]
MCCDTSSDAGSRKQQWWRGGQGGGCRSRRDVFKLTGVLSVVVSKSRCYVVTTAWYHAMDQSRVQTVWHKKPVDLDGLFLENGSFDYSLYEYEEDKPQAYEAAVVFLPVLYSLAMVVGLLGNGLVLGVLFQLRRTWSVTDTFILHLAVADTLLLLTLPFWAVEAIQGWTFGSGLCKLTGAIFRINFYSGIFLLACISLDRYLSIVHAVQMYSRRKSWVVQASCLSVWLFCLLLSIPDWVFLKSVQDPGGLKKSVCTYSYPGTSGGAPDWRMQSRILYHAVGFALPAVVMMYCYSRVLLRLHGGSKQNVIRVVLALVAVFFISWTPYNAALLVDTFRQESKDANVPDRSLVVTTALGYLHSCLNPIVYTCICVNFRHHLLDKLRLRSQATANHDLSLWDQAAGPPSGQSVENGTFNPMET